MPTQSHSGISLGLLLFGLVGCSDEQAGEEAGSGSASATATSDAAVDNIATDTAPALITARGR